jgi:hypothetical protein
MHGLDFKRADFESITLLDKDVKLLTINRKVWPQIVKITKSILNLTGPSAGYGFGPKVLFEIRQARHMVGMCMRIYNVGDT